MPELQYDLIDNKKSGRGGVRDGAGRPKGEETKRVRVPVGCLDAVMQVIEAYKTGQQSNDAESIPDRKAGQQSKPDNSSSPIRKTGQKSKIIDPPMMQTNSGEEVPVKYWWNDGSGSNVYWHGRGRRPKWFNEYIASGGSKSDLDIGTWTDGAKWQKPQ